MCRFCCSGRLRSTLDHIDQAEKHSLGDSTWPHHRHGAARQICHDLFSALHGVSGDAFGRGARCAARKARARRGAGRARFDRAESLLELRARLCQLCHTANSAGWGRHAAHIWHFTQFLLSQFLVYGPVLFFMLFLITAMGIRDHVDRRVVMLLAFSLPILILIPCSR